MLVLITLAVAVVAPSGIAESIGGAIQAAFCKMSGGSCPSAPTAMPDPFRPERCSVSERTYQGSVEVGAHVFQLDEGLNLVRTDYSDGMSTFRAVNDKGFGVSASKGYEVVMGRSYGNSAGVSASLTAGLGDSWSVRTDEAEAMESQLKRAVPAQRLLQPFGPVATSSRELSARSLM